MAELQIISRDFRLTPALRTYIRKYADKLETFNERILRCEVTISAPHRNKRKGKIYHVSIRVQVPGPDVVVNREAEEDPSHQDLRLAIHDAFRVLDRRLEDQVRKLRGDVKRLEPTTLHGLVLSVYPDLDHGFLETANGREVYFHRNSVKGTSLEQLKEGTPVRFQVEQGDEGPQATVVTEAGRIGKVA
ncbi:MAG: HPF/RaiA family ribosome-associated protein [Bdellovibrionota bacterium]